MVSYSYTILLDKGQIMIGEGKMSLSRAFIQAGCPNVVSSLWNAPIGPTTGIMDHFLTAMRQEMPLDQALQEAKLHHLMTDDPMPHLWSNFKLIGGDQIICLPHFWRPWYIYLIGLLILVAVGIGRICREEKNR
ncbi:MAG: CHAT domain-containing protein [Bacteroidota bacterium]